MSTLLVGGSHDGELWTGVAYRGRIELTERIKQPLEVCASEYVREVSYKVELYHYRELDVRGRTYAFGFLEGITRAEQDEFIKRRHRG